MSPSILNIQEATVKHWLLVPFLFLTPTVVAQLWNSVANGKVLGVFGRSGPTLHRLVV